MKIAVIGATGMAGSRIAVEAAQRGHTVSGFSRSGVAPSRYGSAGVSKADACDADAMRSVSRAHDVIVLATRPKDGSANSAQAAVSTVLDAALLSGSRVLVIGGAASLVVPGGTTLVLDDERYVPGEWRAIAQASVAQFAACMPHEADWVYLSPPAVLRPGERTGRYRRGIGELLVDARGVSQISAEDLAVAAVDEIEEPRVAGRHFTVAY